MRFSIISLLCLPVQRGESALQLAVRQGYLDMVKVLIQVYREHSMEDIVGQDHMDLAEGHHHEHLVEYLSSEFPTLKRKVSYIMQNYIIYIIILCDKYTCLSSCIDV